METSRHTTQKSLFKPAVAGFVLAVLSILVTMSGPIGSRIGVWNYDFAVTLATGSAAVALLAAALCLAGLVTTRPGGHHRGFVFSLLGMLIVVPLIGYLLLWTYNKNTLPAIQDITTNTAEPLLFWQAPNSRVHGGRPVAILQYLYYPEIQPLILPLPADRAFDLTLEVIADKGWQLWPTSRDELHIEATERTFWFGFSDDVAIEITAIDAESSQVDMRSTSRFGGGGDGGTNANRIRSFFEALEKRSRE